MVVTNLLSFRSDCLACDNAEAQAGISSVNYLVKPQYHNQKEKISWVKVKTIKKDPRKNRKKL